MLAKLATLLAFVSCASCADAAASSPLKILVYNVKFGHSHSTFLGIIADILSEEGHNVTSLIPEIYPSFADGTSKSRVIRISVDPWVERYWRVGVESNASQFLFKNEGWDKTAMIEQLPLLRDSFLHQCNHTLNHAEIISNLRQASFDLVIAETFDFCGIGLSHLISPRSLITVASTNLFDHLAYRIGQPLFPAFILGSYGRTLQPASVWSRVDNLLAVAKSLWIGREKERPIESLFKQKFGGSFPDFADIIANCSLTLANSDPLLDFARPTLRKVVEIGGINVRSSQPLDEHWSSVVALRPRTVLVSFGTVSRAFLMPIEMRTALAQAFSRFPDTTFVWKYEKPDEQGSFAKGVHNLMLTKWMPQNDLLADDRVRGFLTHAGKGSFFEAASRGKAVLLVPLFGDQYRNAAVVEHLGFGSALPKEALDDANAIERALTTMLDDESVSERALQIKRIIDGRPFTPRQLLTRNVAFAGRFGLQQALQPQMDISYLVSYNIDLIFFSVIIILTIVSAVIALVIACIRKSKTLFVSKDKTA